MSAAEFEREFLSLQTLVHNLRSVLPPMTEGQSQLVGLYLLNALYLGAGDEFDTFPVLREEPRPALTVIPGGLDQQAVVKK